MRLYTDAVREGNPAAAYGELRDFEARYGEPYYDSVARAFVPACYDSVRDVLRYGTNELTVLAARAAPEAREVLGEHYGYPDTIQATDGARHSQLRTPLARAFRHPERSVSAERSIRQEVDAEVQGLLGKVASEGADVEVDFRETFQSVVLGDMVRTYPVPPIKIPKLGKGIYAHSLVWGDQLPDVEQQVAWARDIVDMINEADATRESYASGEVPPDDTIMSYLVHSTGLNPKAIKENFAGLESAGFLTVTATMDRVAASLLSDGGSRWRRLAQNPAGVKGEVARLMDLLTGVHGWIKSLDGKPYIALIEAANNDPARGADDPPLTYGLGPHRCLGERKARIIGTTVLDALIRAFPRARLVEQPHSFSNLAFSDVDKLQVRLGEPAQLQRA